VRARPEGDRDRSTRPFLSQNDFFDGKIDVLITFVMGYLDKRLEGGGARCGGGGPG
jgi:hypothetical protein